MAPFVSGTFDNWTFQADSSLVVGVFPQPNHSGDNGRKPGAFGVHDIEAPPAVKTNVAAWFGRLYASLFGPDYLQNPAEQHSVQYGAFGSVLLQGIPESWWAWGMGTPCSRYTTHVEQSGYASFTEPQWRGRASAIDTTFQRASDGAVMTYTAEMAEAMSSQFLLMATLYADWCKRNGYTPKLGTMDELIRTTQGEMLGIAFTHAMASQVPGTTTGHYDPGSNYPMQAMVDLALQIFLGVGPKPPTPPTPSILNPVEFEMTLPGAPADLTYQQHLKNQAEANWNAPSHLPGNLSTMRAVVANTQQILVHVRAEVNAGVNAIITGLNRIIKKIGA